MIARLLLLLSFSAGLSLSACDNKPKSTEASSTAEPDGVYKLRGVVKGLPQAPGGTLRIQHEAVPDFKNADGKKVGMMSMTMAFYPKDGQLPDGLKVGDKISFDYQVRFKGKPMNGAANIEKLPNDAELKLKE